MTTDSFKYTLVKSIDNVIYLITKAMARGESMENTL